MELAAVSKFPSLPLLDIVPYSQYNRDGVSKRQNEIGEAIETKRSSQPGTRAPVQ
jgi:hypothetical protein